MVADAEPGRVPAEEFSGYISVVWETAGDRKHLPDLWHWQIKHLLGKGTRIQYLQFKDKTNVQWKTRLRFFIITIMVIIIIIIIRRSMI